MNAWKPLVTAGTTVAVLLLLGVSYLAWAHGRPHSARDLRLFDMAFQKSVERGYKLFHDSGLGTTGQSCDMCHPDAANTHPETYPKYQAQIKKVVALRDMINWCIKNPLQGRELSAESPEMVALEAYITSQRKGVPLAPGRH